MRLPPPNALKFQWSQKLYLLKDQADAKVVMHPEKFRQDRQGRSDDQPAEPDQKLWRPLDRQHLVDGRSNGESLHRVVLTTDAGTGKSYNLRQILFALNDPDRRELAFLLAIGDLKNPKRLIENHLLRHFDTEWCGKAKMRDELRHLRDMGEICILFDGLDQASDRSVQNLAEILGNPKWSKSRVIVAGRPFAIEKHWPTLFEAQPWRFVQIAEFDKKQQIAALGEERYNAIPRDAHNVLTIPRVLELIVKELTMEDLRKLKTVADVYWLATKRMLEKAIESQVNPRKFERLLALIGALAFVMYARTMCDPKMNSERPNLDRILAVDMAAYLEDVQRRMQAAIKEYTEDKFDNDLKELSQFNRVVFNHGFLDVNAIHQQEDLIWRNASLQEFFSAYWYTRWGQPEDAVLAAGWLVDKDAETNSGFYWFWRYASEMPDAAIQSDSRKAPARWIAAMKPLYLPPQNAQGHPIRSTEFIFRSWLRMEKWQAEPLVEFLEEFPRIRDTKSRKSDDRKKKAVAARIDQEWRSIPAGQFVMGQGRHDDEPPHPVTITKPFRLQAYPVTNEIYELFSPGHRFFRWYRYSPHPLVEDHGPGADDRCPVVNVDFYDAWVCAKWFGACLPSEAQWEYACHAWNANGESLEYWSGNGEQALTEVGWYEDNSDRRTHPVGEKERPNHWGLHDLHGQVFEWCEDWFDGAYYQRSPKDHPICSGGVQKCRTVRGGSWDDFAGYCRASIRIGRVPVARNLNYGLRLASCLGFG